MVLEFINRKEFFAMEKIYRTEHPEPQFERSTWRNLNGVWQFETDNGRSGVARGLFRDDVTLSGSINVPFCPESRLSGIGNTDFLYGVVYKRTFPLNSAECSGRVLLHFGAVDHVCKAYVGETLVGTHKGGYTSFVFDITKAVHEGENTLTVFAEDDTRDPMIPSGKQCDQYRSYGCLYTRTTGIWQTVWLEFVPQNYIRSVRFFPNPDQTSVSILANATGTGELTVSASFEGKPMGTATAKVCGGKAELCLPLAEKHLWEIGKGGLYDLTLTYGNDEVKSYFGLRSVGIEGHQFLLNGKSVFQRLILDQGFYPDGIYTAPSDEALEKDIRLSMSFGFNGARLHEKIFEPRFLAHCDRLGYIVWGEFPNWGLDHTDPLALYAMLPAWMEELERDFNHPSIIGWCPFNETWERAGKKQCDDLIRTVYEVTKATDPTRPCLDSSGSLHVATDIFDVHDYLQDPAALAEQYEKMENGGEIYLSKQNNSDALAVGKPYFVSEFGGIKWAPATAGGWGYGNAPKTPEEFFERFRGLCEVLMNNKRICGFCYTQLTDVEQEQNGVCYYDRTPKFDAARFREVLSAPAAIETE